MLYAIRYSNIYNNFIFFQKKDSDIKSKSLNRYIHCRTTKFYPTKSNVIKIRIFINVGKGIHFVVISENS